MGNFLAIDFETANNSRTSACSVGLVCVEEGRIVSEQVFLIRPPDRQFIFTYIHGITWDDVKTEPTFEGVWAEIKALADQADFLAAHNAPFDRGVLRQCCESYGLEVPCQQFVCTVQVARKQWNVYPTKLPDVCRRLGIPLQHHDALSDARACANIIIRAEAEGWRHAV